MRFTLLNTLILLACSAAGPLAHADTPDTVGRIAAVHGQVSIVGTGEESAAASLNWPVSSGDRLSTVRGAGAEFRVGSTAVRLDEDSELEVSQLDDDTFRLRLNRGTVAVRVSDPDVVGGFELDTADTRVVLLQPGWVRVDAGREPGALAVSVLAGSAQVDGPGASLQVLAGRRADLNNGDLLTGSLQSDSFDDWPQPRQAAPAALQYVSSEVTGYEELDRYGSWSENAEYGPLWIPSTVSAGWAPYRDGRWIWRDAWGWTWIDAAPWGYAPSHYGSWVQIGPRWGWAPGRGRPRPVWAPALVGWNGGYPDRPRGPVRGVRGPAPAVGWFPLKPRDRYVPGYRATPEYARRVEAYRAGRADARPARPANGGGGGVRGFEPNRGQPGRVQQPLTIGNMGQVRSQHDNEQRDQRLNAQRENEQRFNAQRENALRDNAQRENAQRQNEQRFNAQRDNAQRDNGSRDNIWRDRDGQPRQADPGRQLRGREIERRNLQTESPAVMPQPVMSSQPVRQQAERPVMRPPQIQTQAQPQAQPQQAPPQRPQVAAPPPPQQAAPQRPQPQAQPQAQPQRPDRVAPRAEPRARSGENARQMER